MSRRERVIVVGTGPAGAAAARILAYAGFEPLVLEAGSHRARLGLTARIRGVTVAKWKPPLDRRRDVSMLGDPSAELFESLAPGGLSNHWACAVPRFAPEDFTDAARSGEVNRWPLDYPELVPWYERVEQWLSVAGSVQDRPRLPAGRVSARWELASTWEALAPGVGATGRSLVAMPYAYGAQTTVTRAGTPFNAFKRLVQPAQDWHGLSVRYEARALSLVWSAGEGRVTAVRCRNPRTSAEELVPCRAVVLAAGAVNSAQILLESANADFPAGLGNTQDVLGRYLHDHPLAKIVLELGRRVPIVPASYITRPALEFSEPLYASAFMQWSGAAALSRTAIAGHPGTSSEVGFSIFGTMAPTREDLVKLDPTPTGAGPSPLLVSLRHPPEAVALLERSRDELVEWMALAGWEPRLKSFHVEPPGNSVHYGGTCRMHDSPRFGVVDRFCRVHGVHNVAVADSSVFTTGPEKNPVLTAMALAARASDRLALEMREGDL